LSRVTVLCFCLLVSLAWPVLADSPIDGIYYSPPLGIDMHNGRFSEAWIGGHQGAIDNTVHALSWDESDLGTDWQVLCPVLADDPVLLENTVDEYGNGHMKWRTEYSGGKFWLSGAGPWANGDPYYDGTLTYYAHTTVIQFEAGQQVGYNTTAQLQGYFDAYGEKCIDLTIANAASEGIDGVPPAGYPVLKDGSVNECDDAAPDVVGEWGSVTSIFMYITGCATATEESSWGAIKSIYR
jgi:hypothetical protein